jgi:hypothetical protein
MISSVLIGSVAAAIPGVIACVVSGILMVRIRTLRRAQRVLLPDGGTIDLIDVHAEFRRDLAAIEQEILQVGMQVDSAAQLTALDVARCLRVNGVVRYDAYGEMGGQQSWSVALLDASGTGAVMTCLHARDHARMYVKDVTEGISTQRLSPEEVEAIALATHHAVGEPA